MLSLKDYHVSETCGFLVEDPLGELPDYFYAWNSMGKKLSYLVEEKLLRHEMSQGELPEYFSVWNSLGKSTGSLVECKDLRNQVCHMPLLDHTRLRGYRQKRLAYMLLVFIQSGYLWQDGESGVTPSIPRNLAIPLCAIAKDLGLPTVMCHSTQCLSNWQLKDNDGPLAVENMHAICVIRGGRHCEWFCIMTAQVELDAVPGLKCIPQIQEGIIGDNFQTVITGLKNVADSIHKMTKGLKRFQEELGTSEFYDVIRPFLSGFGGPGTALPGGLVYEGVSDTPVQLTGGSAAQSSSLQSFDKLLGIQHDSDKQAFLDKMLSYMPPAHADFIRAIGDGPSVRDFVQSSTNAELHAAYDQCVDAVTRFRSIHIQTVTKYIVIPSKRTSRQRDFDAIAERGTGGQDMMPFLKALRNTTGSSKIQQ